MAKSKALRAKGSVQKGVTLVELLVVLGILAIIFSFTMVNIAPLRDRASLNTVTDVLLSDIRQQQLKAMIGDTEGNTARSPYGIYITSDAYTVFPGASYSADNTKNFTIQVDESAALLTTITNNTLLFASGSGEFINYEEDADSITVRIKQTGEQKVIRFNQYGVITQVQ